MHTSRATCTALPFAMQRPCLPKQLQSHAGSGPGGPVAEGGGPRVGEDMWRLSQSCSSTPLLQTFQMGPSCGAQGPHRLHLMGTSTGYRATTQQLRGSTVWARGVFSDPCSAVSGLCRFCGPGICCWCCASQAHVPRAAQGQATRPSPGAPELHTASHGGRGHREVC